MKKLILFLSLVISLIIFPFEVNAETMLIQTTLSKKPKEKDPAPVLKGHRTPPMQILCIIDKNNIRCVDISEKILCFEILHEDACLFSAFEEYTFITNLFSLSGEYTIRFSTDNYIYEGSIILPNI